MKTILFFVLLSLIVLVNAQTGSVRFFQGSPSTPTITTILLGSQSLTLPSGALNFTQYAGPFSFNGGVNITLQINGTEGSIWSGTVNISAQNQTFAIMGTYDESGDNSTLQVVPVAEDDTTPAQSRFVFVNAVENAPDFDLRFNNYTQAGNVSYTESQTVAFQQGLYVVSLWIPSPSSPVLVTVFADNGTELAEGGVFSFYATGTWNTTTNTGDVTIIMFKNIFYQPTDGYVRFVNFDSATYDIYVDYNKQYVALGAFENTSYINIFSAQHLITVTPTGEDTVSLATNVTCNATSYCTFAIVSGTPLNSVFISDPFSMPEALFSYIRVVNTIPDQSFNVNISGMALNTEGLLGFGDASPYMGMRSADYTLTIVNMTSVVQVNQNNATVPITLANFEDYTAWIYQNSTTGAISVLTTVDKAYPVLANIKFFNSIYNTSGKFGFWIDGKTAGNVSYASSTNAYQGVTSGSNHTLTVTRATSANTSETILTETFSLESGYYTMAVLGFLNETLSTQTYADSGPIFNKSAAYIRFINLSPNSVSTQTGSFNLFLNNTVNFTNVDFMQSTNYVFLDVDEYDAQLQVPNLNATKPGKQISYGDPLRDSLLGNTSYTVYAVGYYKNSPSLELVLVQDYPNPPKAPNGLSPMEIGLIIGGAVLLAIIVLGIIIFYVTKRPDGYEELSK